MTAPAPSADELLAHTDWLLQLARALVGDAAAPDVVQETFEVAITKPPQEAGPLRPWLAGVARNLAKMARRGQVRRERRELAAPVAPEMPSADELIERARMQQRVAAIVLELPPVLRTTLLLRFFEGMSAAQIARAQGIPGATVRSRLADALARVRAALDQTAGPRRHWVALVTPLPLAGAHGSGAAVAGGMLVKTGTKIAITVLLLALAAAVAGWRLDWFGGGSPAAPPAIAAAGQGRGAAVHAPPPGDGAAAAPAARSPAIAHDDDPAGTLRLEGQVIDGDDQPVGGARVALDAHPTQTVTTEADGSFVFESLIPRDYRLEATAHDGYAGPVRVRLTARTEPVTLRLADAGRVEVVVTAAGSGKPIANAAVELRSTLVWTATTGTDGIATLRGVGATWSPLVARAPGYAPAAIMLSTAGSPTAPVRVALALATGAAIAGRVVDAAGTPVADARVVATSASEPFPLVDARRDGVRTAADGTFTIASASAGTWRVTATAGDFAPATSAPLTVDGTHPRTGVELVLGEGATIRGVVRTATGSPVAAAEVRAMVRGTTEWRAQRQTFTADDGTFAIRGLPRRAVEVVAAHATGASAIAGIDLAAAPAAELVLTLEVVAAIHGVVVSAAGEPVGDARVIAEPVWSGGVGMRERWAVRGIPEAVTDQAGAFAFPGLPAGRYTVRAVRLGASAAALQLAAGIEATPGPTPLRIVVAEEATVIGKVAMADGSVPPAFTVALSDTLPVPFASADGSFALPAVAGTHRLVVDGRRFLASVVKSVTVTAGRPTDVGTITVQPGRSISGRVLDANQVPVAGARVAAGTLLTGGGAELYIPDESPGAKDTVTDEAGRFSLAGFGTGSVTILAGKDTLRSASVRLPASPDSATLDLILQPTAGLEGIVTQRGAPLADVVVIANPVGATASNFFVQTGPDGTFVLDALAPGSYVVYPMLGRGGSSPKDMFVKQVEVVPGARAKLAIDASPGEAQVEVHVKLASGGPAPVAMVFLIGAAVSPRSGNELRDLDQLGVFVDRVVPIAMRTWTGEPVQIAGARAGASTVCAMPPPKQTESPILCQPLAVGAAGTLTVTLVVPAAWYEST